MPSGPLVGMKVVEFAGLGPGPFAGMLLSDLGAEVIEIAREGAVSLTLTRLHLPSAGQVGGRSQAASICHLAKAAERLSL